jgi:FtsH-binding integral membrane protein
MELTESKLISKTFMWMFIGLAITFGVGYCVSCNENMLFNLFSGYKWLILVIAEFGLVIALSAFITKLSPVVAKSLFCVYALVTGLTFSAIFVAYELGSIIYVFGITGIVFLIFALLGYYTNMDLSKLGTYLFMALIAIIIASIINIFIGSSSLEFGITIIGVLIFVGYVAYDINMLKKSTLYEQDENLPIYWALQLYLDFINLFIKLLRLLGKERN